MLFTQVLTELMTKNKKGDYSKNKNHNDTTSSNKLIEPVTDNQAHLSNKQINLTPPTPNTTPISSPQTNSNENKDSINNILLNSIYLIYTKQK